MDSTLLQESVRFTGAAALPGVELLDAQQSTREWRIFNTQYSLAVPNTWRGEVTYRGGTHDVGSGMVFCSEPGEVHTAAPKYRPGSFRVLGFDGAVLGRYLAEQEHLPSLFSWSKSFHTMSRALAAAMNRIFQTLGPDAQPMELESDLIALVNHLRQELVDGAPPTPSCRNDDVAVARRIRECLHQEGIGIDLAALSERVGVSRFRALRTFKRHYGLPPHAYQLCVRIALAQRLLKDGHGAADVAAECGFVDQSHLTRHFKRLIGTTPARFAAAAGRGGWKDGQEMPGSMLALYGSDRA